MTPTIITTAKGGFLFVPVPEDLSGIFTTDRERKVLMCVGAKWETSIPPGTWQILFQLSKATEEQAGKVVGKLYPFGGDLKPCYIDYVNSARYNSVRYRSSSLESLSTLMEANKIYRVNPYGDEPSCGRKPDCFRCQGQRCKWLVWSEAQSSTSPDWVVLKEINN